MGITLGSISFGPPDQLRRDINKFLDKVAFEQAESEVLKACLQYMAVKGCCPVRHNNGGVRDGNHYRSKPKGPGYEDGQPDILACWQGKALAVECKATKGKQSKAQIDWQARWEKAGGIYILARSLAVLIEEMGDDSH